MIGDRFRIFLMAVRQSLIILIGALEEYLEIDRSIIPRHKRGNKEYAEYEKLTAEVSRK
jgi:hypothetical protein